jgi:plasmid stabilization system protein ParE
MKVVYTEDALRDLDEILEFIGANYPTVTAPFLGRLRTIEGRIGQWPESAPEVEQRPGIRTVPFIRYPYRLFYRVTSEAVEILHIRHAARQAPRTGED